MQFPFHDPVGPDEEALSGEAIGFLAEHIGETAERTDVEGVQRETLLALGKQGFYDVQGVSAALLRERAEVLAGCDATTWFCWVQHFTPMRTLADAGQHAKNPDVLELRTQWLSRLQHGGALSAIAFAHLRRPGDPNPVATRVAGGWLLNGSLDWVTSWDVADVVLTMVHDKTRDHVVQMLLPAGYVSEPLNGFEVGEPLRLFAMGGTHTRPARLADVYVPDSLVVDVIKASDWNVHDDQRTPDVNPATFGVTRGAIAELDDLATHRDDTLMHELAQTLTAECRSLRSQAYALLGKSDVIDRRLELRAQSLDLVVRATTAVVVARAGAAMMEGASATRRLREAMFLQVQAQTASSRAASLRLAICER